MLGATFSWKVRIPHDSFRAHLERRQPSNAIPRARGDVIFDNLIPAAASPPPRTWCQIGFLIPLKKSPPLQFRDGAFEGFVFGLRLGVSFILYAEPVNHRVCA